MVENNNTPFGQELAYDLRQIYVRIVGAHLVDIADSRKEANYGQWFKNIEDLHVIVKHKFKSPEKDEEAYQKLIEKAIEVAKQYTSVWLQQNREAKACSEIEKCLRDIEMFLYKKMDDAKMFGSGGTIQGL